MLADKMAISHSNHLFVPVVFVFCFLSPLIHASDSYDYTNSRQFEKNPTVSRHRNNIQRLPNYIWKPPDKYYGPSKESTERNLEMEFTKPEDSEQRMADPWIKKMQEISRQEREKWAAYRRNVKLTLDNVGETTKTGKLTNDESITIPIFSNSEKYYENIKKGAKLPMKLFEESLETNVELDPTLKPLVQHLTTDQDNMNVKENFGDQFHSSWIQNSKQYTNVDRVSNKKLKSNEWNTDIKSSSEKFFQKVPITATHERNKVYEISNIKKDPFFKRNGVTNYEKSKLEEDHLSSIINSHPEQSISQQIKDLYIRKRTNTSENDKNLNHTNSFNKFPTKKYAIQFNFPQNNKMKSSNDNKEEEKITNSLIQKSEKNDKVNLYPEELIFTSKSSHLPKTPVNKNFQKFSETESKDLNHKSGFKFVIKPYARQSSSSQNDNEENNKKDEKTIAAKLLRWEKKENHNVGGKDVTEKLNHEKSFYSGRWGMSVSSPPAKFLNDMSRRSIHRKNEEQIEKDGKHHLFGRWGMSIASPPKEFYEDISRHRGDGTERFIAKVGSRLNEVKGSFDSRSPIHQNDRNLQTLVQQLMTDERYKKLVETFLGKVPNRLYDSRYPDPNYWNNHPTNTDFNNGLFLGFLQALSYIWQDNMTIPMSCHMRIPYASFRT